jgi:hypothetical protein
MSSESGESEAGGDIAHGAELEPENGRSEPLIDAQDAQELVSVSKAPESDHDAVWEELGNGPNGASFARLSKRKTKDDPVESASKTALGSFTQRATSPESASTPDDTPSIQVGIPGPLGESSDDRRALGYPLQAAAYQHRTVP